MQIIAVALKHAVRLDLDFDKKVPGRAAIDPWFAIPALANTHSFIDASGNPDF
jgi:hypothetical protein